jgi:hypothetical protein
MRFWLLASLLGLGALAGFACGLHSLHGWRHGPHGGRRAEFEAHVADVCTRAAEKVMRERGRSDNSAPP